MDIITQEKSRTSGNGVTSSAILGPFWRSDTPVREFGSSITFDTASDAEVAYLYGTVTDAETGKPIPNALVDVWQASTNGKCSYMLPKPLEDSFNGVPLLIPDFSKQLTGLNQACTNSRTLSSASTISVESFIPMKKGSTPTMASGPHPTL